MIKYFTDSSKAIIRNLDVEDQMKVRQLFTAGAMLAGVTFQTVAADWYVSFSTGKNKNAGTQEAPLKNIWKALESPMSRWITSRAASAVSIPSLSPWPPPRSSTTSNCFFTVAATHRNLWKTMSCRSKRWYVKMKFMESSMKDTEKPLKDFFRRLFCLFDTKQFNQVF